MNKLRKKYDVLFTFGDRHLPHQDLNVERILLEMMTDLEPDIVLEGGDMISADSLSTYEKSWEEMVGLQNELDQDFLWRTQVNAIVPIHTKKILLQDNHFVDRLNRRKKKDPWLQDLDSMNPNSMLRMDELDWDLVVEWNWKNKLLAVHGDDKITSTYNAQTANPINKARNMVRQHHISVIRYHTHVSGMESYRMGGEYKYALQLGTSQDLIKTNYLKHKDLVNWTRSAAVIYLSKKTTEFFIVPIFFNEESAVLNGKLYTP